MMIQVGGPEYQISAAHFLASPNLIESLHGHNYLVSISLEFSDLVDGMAADFNLVGQTLFAGLHSLQQRVLLAEHNSRYKIQTYAERQEIEVSFAHSSRRYIFPLADTVLLPFNDTTTENIALYLQERFGMLWQRQNGRPYDAITIIVEEAPGRVAQISKSYGGPSK